MTWLGFNFQLSSSWPSGLAQPHMVTLKEKKCLDVIEPGTIEGLEEKKRNEVGFKCTGDKPSWGDSEEPIR